MRGVGDITPGSKKLKLIRFISDKRMGYIIEEENKKTKKKEPQKGPRQIFMESLRKDVKDGISQNEAIENAKNALINNGINPNTYKEGVFETWIEEDKER